MKACLIAGIGRMRVLEPSWNRQVAANGGKQGLRRGLPGDRKCRFLHEWRLTAAAPYPYKQEVLVRARRRPLEGMPRVWPDLLDSMRPRDRPKKTGGTLLE